MRIHEKRFSTYYPGFEEFLKNHHQLTGKPADAVVAFDVWYVGRYINPPGQGFSKNFYRKLFSFGAVKDSGVPESERPKPKPIPPSRSTQCGARPPAVPRLGQPRTPPGQPAPQSGAPGAARGPRSLAPAPAVSAQ
jgi:hypothetical protein